MHSISASAWPVSLGTWRWPLLPGRPPAALTPPLAVPGPPVLQRPARGLHRLRRHGLLAASLLAVGLLAAFGVAVNEVVLESRARRQAAELHALGVWQCYASQGRSLREACMQALDRQPAAVPPADLP